MERLGIEIADREARIDGGPRRLARPEEQQRIGAAQRRIFERATEGPPHRAALARDGVRRVDRGREPRVIQERSPREQAARRRDEPRRSLRARSFARAIVALARSSLFAGAGADQRIERAPRDVEVPRGRPALEQTREREEVAVRGRRSRADRGSLRDRLAHVARERLGIERAIRSAARPRGDDRARGGLGDARDDRLGIARHAREHAGQERAPAREARRDHVGPRRAPRGEEAVRERALGAARDRVEVRRDGVLLVGEEGPLLGHDGPRSITARALDPRADRARHRALDHRAERRGAAVEIDREAQIDAAEDQDLVAHRARDGLERGRDRVLGGVEHGERGGGVVGDGVERDAANKDVGLAQGEISYLASHP